MDDGRTLIDTGLEQRTMSSIKFELARMEAKIDILTALVMKSESSASPSTITSTPTTASEHALCRSMTTKQHVTLQLLIQGKSNLDIAKVINIGENTVKLHVRAVCKKVGCKTRGQAAPSDVRNLRSHGPFRIRTVKRWLTYRLGHYAKHRIA